MSTRFTLAIALHALARNRLQTTLTVLGMTIGVGAVLTMVAIGTGAESAIEDQIRAAGMNLIVVTAGNYKVKSTEDFGGGAVEPSAALRPPDAPPRATLSGSPGRRGEAESLARHLFSFVEPTLLAHPEDDPM